MMTSLTGIFAKHRINQIYQRSLKFRFRPLNFGILQILPFPKAKLTVEKETISDCRRDYGERDMAADGDPESDFTNCFEKYK